MARLLAHHSNFLGILPCPCAAIVCIPAADGAGHGHPCWACHLSWFWNVPHLHGVHGIGPCLARQRHIPSPHFHPPAAQVCGPPPLECDSGLGGDVSQGQRPFLTPWWCLVLLKETPYPTGAYPHHPMLPPERGCSVVPAWSLTSGNFSPPDNSHVNPSLLLLPVPTSWCLQRGAQSHS